MRQTPLVDGVMGLIPAGGRSSRFGSPKALFVLDGAALVERVHRALSSVLADVRLGLASPGDEAPLAGVPCVYDNPVLSGASGSLRGAFVSSACSWVLVAACDMPGLTTQAVERLLEARRDDVDVVVAVDTDGAVHPLFACYRRTCLEALDRHVAGENRSMRRFVASLRRAEVTFDATVVWNVNRPEDLEGPGTASGLVPPRNQGTPFSR